MMERDDNNVGQIYRIPEGAHTSWNHEHGGFASARLREGDLVVCLERTGDNHYEWARLDWKTRTQSTNNSLPVRSIKNYYDIGYLFSGYALPMEWEILQEPMSHERMLGALIAMCTSGRTGLLLPLFPEEHAEYLQEQERLQKASSEAVQDAFNPEQKGVAADEWPKLKS